MSRLGRRQPFPPRTRGTSFLVPPPSAPSPITATSAIQFWHHLDVRQNQLLRARLENLSADPVSPAPVAGRVYWSTVLVAVRVYDGAAWQTLIPSTIFDAKGDLLTATANDTPVILPVGANGRVLTANSAVADGIEWAALPATGAPTVPTHLLAGETTTVADRTQMTAAINPILDAGASIIIGTESAFTVVG